MSALRVFAVRSLCGLLLCAPAIPQQSAPPKPAPATTQTPATAPGNAEPLQIIVQANEVIVPITVTDEKGRFVSNLVKEDFRILDEGRPQRIRFFSRLWRAS